MEASAADREIVLTRVTSALVLGLAILYWATTPLPEDRSIGFSIQWGHGGDLACTGDGECSEGAEMIEMPPAMPQGFEVAPAMVWDAGSELKQVSLWRWPKRLGTTIYGLNDEMNVGRSTEAGQYGRVRTASDGGERSVPASKVAMMATFARGGLPRLSMRMIFVSAGKRERKMAE
jgi:hypothetical protein